MNEKLIVPISYFLNEPISRLIELNLLTGKKKILFEYFPNEQFKVFGKGFTQIEFDKKKELFIVADYNQVHILDKNYKIIKSIRSNTMNDIHGVTLFNNNIVITNTGNDSIEIYSIEGVFQYSTSLLSFEESQNRYLGKNFIDNDNYYDNDLTKSFKQRKIRDKFHINNSTIIDNRIIVTSFKEKTLIDLMSLKKIAPPLISHIHDCILYQNELWITSVDGKIYKRDPNINSFIPFELFVDLFEIGDSYGWCRGILELDGYFYIGITQINSKLPKSRWSDIDFKKTKTGIIKLDIKTKKIIDFYDFTDKNVSRIFGFISL